MSFSVNKRTEIKLTRGDTLRVSVGITKDGQPYTPQEGEVVRFALKPPTLNARETEYVQPDPLILKVIPNDTMLLELDPADTKSLGFGEYEYDIEITLLDGTVDTFITATKFTLTREVH